jgi:enoyl-CoA hydratase
VLSAFSKESAGFTALQPAIDQLFAGDCVEDILAKLDREAASSESFAEFAHNTAAAIRTKSPTSLKLALAQVRAGKALSFDACMQTEFRIVSRIIHGHDFYEGVRAVIVDKDNAPQWMPPTLDEVDPRDIERHFAPLARDELKLP